LELLISNGYTVKYLDGSPVTEIVDYGHVVATAP
jgi:hypothetical protein